MVNGPWSGALMGAWRHFQPAVVLQGGVVLRVQILEEDFAQGRGHQSVRPVLRDLVERSIEPSCLIGKFPCLIGERPCLIG